MAKNPGGIVVEILLDVEHVLAKGGEIHPAVRGVHSLMAFADRNTGPPLILKPDLFLVVEVTLEPRDQSLQIARARVILDRCGRGHDR